ncbi:hypothetical protein BJH92_23915 [Paenibacillus polymyxa]|nr:hypothetical protein BJH92_23915 [Paenibacillus polymyxa]KJK28537.1 hypothetical protein TY89_22790 [Paenibacillus polymyxa]
MLWRQKHNYQTATTNMRTQILMVYQEWSLFTDFYWQFNTGEKARMAVPCQGRSFKQSYFYPYLFCEERYV